MGEFESGKITSVKRKKGKKAIYEVYVNGEFQCLVSEDLLVSERILPGKTVHMEELNEWIRLGERHEALDKAIRWLGRRPYTKKELIRRLVQEQYSPESAEYVIEELEAKGYLNELEYAIQQAERRIRYQKKGRMWVVSELLEKGVSRDAIDKALQLIMPEEEYEYAKEAGMKKWKQTENLELEKRKRKVGQSLLRRGIPNDLVRRIVSELEEERNALD